MALRELRDEVDDARGALVEPEGNALRAVRAAALRSGDPDAGARPPHDRRSRRDVRPGSRRPGAPDGPRRPVAAVLPLARLRRVWAADTLPDLRWDAAIDTSNAPRLPTRALELVKPGKLYIGLAGSPSLIDTRGLALRDVTVVGILGGSVGLSGAIDAYAPGDIGPTSLVAATVRLEDLAPLLVGGLPGGTGPGPKIHIAIQGGSQ